LTALTFPDNIPAGVSTTLDQFSEEDEMRKVSILIGICMLTGLALTLWAQSEADLPPIMKQIGATQGAMRKALDSQAAADVAANAETLQGLFTKAAGVFKALKAPTAVDGAMANVTAAGEIVKAAQAGNMDAATTAAGTIQKSCKGCHDVHREQLPDKTYKFKQKQ
jgi:cytochrome c556